ncbi:MAG: homing endonuclease associated repeat-containing protein [Burkholderiales bacterium]
MKFELDRLHNYSEDALIAELRRVAGLVEAPYLTKRLFDEHGRVSSSTVVRRFKGWDKAFVRAGLTDRLKPVRITAKMREQHGKQVSKASLISELKRIAAIVGSANVTTQQFNDLSNIDAALIRRRFGSWNKGLKEAGLAVPARARRYSDDECFENLLRVWTHYGRPPRFREMDLPPSEVGGTAYISRWGTFKKALLAFVERVNTDVENPTSIPVVQTERPARNESVSTGPRNKREVPLGVRYAVLNRDRFKCTLCGASPATSTICRLHVDHIIPLARGGSNQIENLRTLCEGCNLGKGARSE